MANRVALVTGAGSGIGRASAILLACRGYSVGVLGHNQEEIVATAAAIAESGGAAIALAADIALENQMREAVRAIVRQFGHLDAVFANAGINGVGSNRRSEAARMGPDCQGEPT